MTWPQHRRYAYSPITQRPVYDWPGERRLAVYIAVNVETFPFGQGLSPELNARQPEPDIVNHGWRDWGNRVGIWNLLEALDAHQLPTAALMNTAVYDHHPQIAAAFRARGDEVVGHGHTNAERAADMSEVVERQMIEACTARITTEEVVRPTGWMSPWVNQSAATPDLLAEAGYSYTLDWPMDDQPVWLTTRSKPLLALPYARPTNDISALHGAKLAPRLWVETLFDAMEGMLEMSQRRPLVFNLSLHPYLIGHAFRLQPFKRFLAHLASLRQEVWIATPGEIARHAMTHSESLPLAVEGLVQR
jgi:allantoinase